MNAKLILFTIGLILLMGTASATDYYVNTSGDNGLAGTSEGTAWDTITYAATQAQAGDTVHIKGGNYGAEHVILTNSGTSGNNITYRGYDGMAVMIGTGDLVGDGYGIHGSSKSYIELHNISVSYYYHGIFFQTSGSYITIENCTIFKTYQGLKFEGGAGTNNIIRNVTAYNNDMHNFHFDKFSDSLVEDCFGCNQAGLGDYADYNFLFQDYSDNNVIRDCISGDESYGFGHGFAVILYSDGNHFFNCTSIYSGGSHFQADRNSNYTIFENCTGTRLDGVGGWVFELKSSHNTIKNCVAEGMDYGVFVFYSSSESLSTVSHNVIENLVSVNNSKGVYLWDSGHGTVNNNTIKNSIIINNTVGIEEDAGITNTVLEYNDVWNNGNNYSGCSAGTGSISLNPLFADYSSLDFHLKSVYGRWTGTTWTTDVVSSPCIDAGNSIDDYSNEPSPNGLRINMGAYGNTIYASKSSGDVTPPTSITGLTNTTGIFSHNWTWTNPIDGDFNYTTIYINDSWVVNISDEYYNLSADAHNQSTISTKTVDTTGNINSTWVNHTSIIPNNAITIFDVSVSYTLNEGETLSIDANYTDPDGDTGTFSDNSTDWNVNSSTGIVSWVTADGDDGTYNYYINISDGYGSINTQAFIVTINNSIDIPPSQNIFSNISNIVSETIKILPDIYAFIIGVIPVIITLAIVGLITGIFAGIILAIKGGI